MSSVRGESPVARDDALAALIEVVADHPGLRARTLLAVMKGRRKRVTEAQLDALLHSGPFEDHDGAWTMRQRGPHSASLSGALSDAAAAGPAGSSGKSSPMTPAAQEDDVSTTPSSSNALIWSMEDLYDVLDASAEDVKHALWVLVANESAPELHWSELATNLRRDGSALLTQRDLRELRGQLNAMAVRSALRPEEADALANAAATTVEPGEKADHNGRCTPARVADGAPRCTAPRVASGANEDV